MREIVGVPTEVTFRSSRNSRRMRWLAAHLHGVSNANESDDPHRRNVYRDCPVEVVEPDDVVGAADEPPEALPPEVLLPGDEGWLDEVLPVAPLPDEVAGAADEPVDGVVPCPAASLDVPVVPPDDDPPDELLVDGVD